MIVDLGSGIYGVFFYIIAVVDKPILGADFLEHYGLLIDVKRCLRDLLTNLISTRVAHNIVAHCFTVANASRN